MKRLPFSAPNMSGSLRLLEQALTECNDWLKADYNSCGTIVGGKFTKDDVYMAKGSISMKVENVLRNKKGGVKLLVKYPELERFMRHMSPYLFA